MPMDNQFSLSLELTRLVPLSLAVVGKTYEGAMKLARDLQSSGSDIVVEEDLAELFGRGRIADSVAKSFRANMSKTIPALNLVGGLSLMRGPGPTVMRALVEPAYFSTVVQCSFLVSIHQPASLATAIVNHLEILAEQAPTHTIRRTIPSYESVKGTLLACENQTTTYQWTWRMQLLTVGELLGCHRLETESTIPPNILQGLIIMLPLIQTLPEDRIIMVETNSGACAIVVWVHFVLGVHVAVRFYNQSSDDYEEMHFPQTGKLSYPVIIYMNISHSSWAERVARPETPKPSITLFSSSTKDLLFEMKEDPRAETIGGNFKRPAKGMWQTFFQSQRVDNKEIGKEKVMLEMAYIACSFALCIFRKMYKEIHDESLSTPKSRRDNLTEPQALAEELMYDRIPLQVDTTRILESFSMLVGMGEHDNPSEKCHQYASFFEGTKWDNIKDPPSSIRSILEEWAAASSFQSSITAVWESLRNIALEFSIIILAFASVVKVKDRSELPLFANGFSMPNSKIFRRLKEWDGKEDFLVEQNTWFEVITLLMLDHRRAFSLDIRNTALISESGFSLYVSSLDPSDPSDVDPTDIIVQRGIPWRHGICKRRVLDGPVSGSFNVGKGKGDVATFPGQVKLECARLFEYGRFMIGEQEDAFLLTTTIENSDKDRGNSGYQRIGSYDFWKSLWMVRNSTPCQHPIRLGASLELQPGWMIISGPGPYGSETYQGLTIFLTAENPAARWNAVHGLASYSRRRGHRIFLRHRDSCLQCAAEEAARHIPHSFLIL